MTKEELAAKLNGRKYDAVITMEETAHAAVAGLVVVYPVPNYSHNIAGAITGEADAWSGQYFRIDRSGVLDSWKIVREDPRYFHEDAGAGWFLRLSLSTRIGVYQAAFGNGIVSGEKVWAYRTEAPVARFSLIDQAQKCAVGGTLYGIGIVLDVAEALCT